MKTCELAVARAKQAFQKSKDKATELRKTMRITKEGEVLDETIAIANEVLGKLNEKDFTDLDSFSRKDVVTKVTGALIRAELTDVFEGAISKNANSLTPRVPLVLRSAEFKNDLLTIRVTPKGSTKVFTYSFERGSNVSKQTTTNNNQLFIPRFSATYEQVADTVFDMKKSLTKQEEASRARQAFADIQKLIDGETDLKTLLGSVKNNTTAFNYKRASLKQNYNHGDVQHMKNLLADLHAIGNNSVTDEVFVQYNELLNVMHPRFFREMNVYIDENAKHTSGWVDLDKNHILLNISTKQRKGMSSTEVFMHETIHSMTAWALQQPGFVGSGLRRKLYSLKKIAYKNITWQDLAKTTPDVDPKEVKARYDYIFNDKTSLEEFLAHALTNPEFMGLLKKIKIREKNATGLFGVIKELFSDIINALMGNYDFKQRDSDVHSEVHALAFKLAEINNRAEESLTEGNIFTQLNNLIDRAEGAFEEWATQFVNLIDTTGSVSERDLENLNRVQRIILIAKFFTKGIYNKDYRHAVGAYLTMVGVKPDWSIREIVRSIMPNLNDTFVQEQLHLETTRIDAIRNTQVVITLEDILKKFKQQPTEEMEEAITAIFLEANGSALFTKGKHDGDGYSAAQVQKLLLDTDYRKKTIGRVEARIKKMSKTRANWIIAQAGGLGRLMVTGQGHEAQLTNSRSIVLGHGTDERFKYDENLFNLVEELAALRAVDHQTTNVRKEAALALKKEPEAVKNIVNLYEAFKAASQENLFKDDIAHMTEGYIKELFDDTIEVRYEPIAEAEEMAKKGFTLVSHVTADTMYGGKELGIYVSKSYSQAERLRGAVGLGNPQSRGLNVKEIRYKQFADSKKHAQVYFEADKIRLNQKAADIQKQLQAGVNYENIPLGSVPILDASGVVVNYRNMMDKALKAKFLKQDRKVGSVLSKTIGTIVDKVEREEQNKRVLKVILKHMREVVDNPHSKDNLMEHTIVSADSEDPAIRQLFFMLPKSYQDAANRRADKSLHIPSILMQQYFGYKHHRLGDMPLIRMLPSTVKHIINMMESVWQDLVKIAKGNVLLKMPTILIGNIVSNVIYALNTGMSPTELVMAYKDSFRDVKAFMKIHKEYESKKIELAALTQNYRTTSFTPEELQQYTDQTKRLRDEVKQLEAEMANSEVKELFDIGMYQSVIENVETYKLGDTNQVSNGMDKLLRKMPTIIKTPLQVMYLSKETAWYKVNQEVLQLSDLIARDVMNRKQKLVEQKQADGKMDLPLEYRKQIGLMRKEDRRRRLEGNEREQFFKIAKQSRHHTLLNAFINYNLPNGRGEEYLNRIGVLMFTKYFKRIQRVITTTGIKHPIRTVGLLAMSSFLLDVDMIQQQSLLTRALEDYDFGFLGVIPVYSPVDVFLNVATPALVKLAPGF